ncbi:MAG: hypothetical protein ACXWUG_08595 [Polyangiales bacterium]
MNALNTHGRGGQPMTWTELADAYRGLWVALDQCRYDEATAKPVEGMVVDADEDLVELCNRIRDAGSHNCAVVFVQACEDRLSAPPMSARAVH